jgi:hypothetical protein
MPAAGRRRKSNEETSVSDIAEGKARAAKSARRP